MVNQIKQRFLDSVMSYVTLSLAAILGITVVSIFISFWLTEQVDRDAQAVNLSGSMRMQTYHIALSLERENPKQAIKAIERLDNTWGDPLFSAQRARLKDPESEHSELTKRFHLAYQHWLLVVKPTLNADISGGNVSKKTERVVEKLVLLTDAVAMEFQNDSARKIVNLRSYQLITFLIIVLVGCLIFYLLKNRVEKPLATLTDTARKIGEGDYSQRVHVEGRDELSLLSLAFNQMGESISDSHARLEERVEQRTKELQQNNIALNFLFNTAKQILESNRKNLDFQSIVNNLFGVLENKKLELCLFTKHGDKPYLHLVSDTDGISNCHRESCLGCLSSGSGEEVLTFSHEIKFSIEMEDRQYGVISLHLKKDERLPDWQSSLVQSVANQFSVALSLSEQKDREYRFAMLSERTVIARELHDSLAQSLSYLKIQVTRLQKSHDKQKFELQQPIIDELREGLSSAYRQLRELLTTFRLKIDEGGLRVALENTVMQLQERTDIKIDLNYSVGNIPLAPNEEIHLLQIVREACQNAIHHSHGSMVKICLQQRSDEGLELTIDDDGVGISSTPEKLNHYGLAIMTERSRSLGGDMKIELRESGGTRVYFRFTPQHAKQLPQ